MAQRAALARALVNDPRILILAGRSLSTTMRDAMNSASSTSCVTSKAVKPVRCHSSTSPDCIAIRVSESSLPRGSS
ncbi:hypothetical protein, partial [Xylella fastidiosa]|uniref:hypothetical protein n=1 Tax=Xylella fastidiosa TaxID=2371 RepID=UPI003CCFD33F